jgi:hypothetical protein
MSPREKHILKAINQRTADVYCNKCNQIINCGQIKKFLEKEKKTEILKEFENLSIPKGKFIIFFYSHYQY